jgi:hypothetical protein
VTGGDVDLQFDEIESGRALGNRMLDLQPGVHLEEEETSVVIGEELDRSRAGVTDGLGGRARRAEQPVAHAVDALDERRGRLLDHLLVPALDRTLTLAQGPHRAERVGHHLHLDVPPGREVRLAEDGGITEGGRSLGACSLDLTWENGQLAHDAHAAPAAAGRCLDQHGQVRFGHCVGRDLVEYRHARGGHDALGRDLAAHRVDRFRRWSDPREPGFDDGTRERGILGQESVARMHGVRAGPTCGSHEQVAAQVGLAGCVAGQPYRGVGLVDMYRRCVRVGEDRDRVQAQIATRAKYSPRDLAAIRHQHRRDHRAPRNLTVAHPEPKDAVIAGTPRSRRRP